MKRVLIFEELPPDFFPYVQFWQQSFHFGNQPNNISEIGCSLSIRFRRFNKIKAGATLVRQLQ
jgi:hypothetical protein